MSDVVERATDALASVDRTKFIGSPDLVEALLAEVGRLRRLNQAMSGQLELWLKGHPMTGERQSAVAALIIEARA